MIVASLVGDDRLLAWLRDVPDTAASGLARTIAKLGIDLQRKVQDDKLSGQVLATRSGSLKSSIALTIDRSTDAISATIYSDSRYAQVHEYGFAGSVAVSASLRRIREAFGRPIAEKAISVRAYIRKMDLPERSFLRSALDDMALAIGDEIDAALRIAVTE